MPVKLHTLFVTCTSKELSNSLSMWCNTKKLFHSPAISMVLDTTVREKHGVQLRLDSPRRHPRLSSISFATARVTQEFVHPFCIYIIRSLLFNNLFFLYNNISDLAKPCIHAYTYISILHVHHLFNIQLISLLHLTSHHCNLITL